MIKITRASVRTVLFYSCCGIYLVMRKGSAELEFGRSSEFIQHSGCIRAFDSLCGLDLTLRSVVYVKISTDMPSLVYTYSCSLM